MQKNNISNEWRIVIIADQLVLQIRKSFQKIFLRVSNSKFA